MRLDLPSLKKADVVFAHLPDTTKLLVKGRDRLDGIIARGVTEKLLIMHVNVEEIEAAAALEIVLGGDGFYSNAQQAGHA